MAIEDAQLVLPYDERLTDEDLGKHVRNAIETCRLNAGRPDAYPTIIVRAETRRTSRSDRDEAET